MTVKGEGEGECQGRTELKMIKSTQRKDQRAAREEERSKSHNKRELESGAQIHQTQLNSETIRDAFLSQMCATYWSVQGGSQLFLSRPPASVLSLSTAGLSVMWCADFKQQGGSGPSRPDSWKTTTPNRQRCKYMAFKQHRGQKTFVTTSLPR